MDSPEGIYVGKNGNRGYVFDNRITPFDHFLDFEKVIVKFKSRKHMATDSTENYKIILTKNLLEW